MENATHLVVYTPTQAALWGSDLTLPVFALTVVCAAVFVVSNLVGSRVLPKKLRDNINTISLIPAALLFVYGLHAIAVVG